MRPRYVEITNVGAARQVSFELSPGLAELIGANKAGKSWALKAFIALLSGIRGLDKKPLTRGEEEGRIFADLGDITLERTINEGNQATWGGQVRVVAKDGKKRGQDFLDTLVGPFSFDPLAFSRMKPADQVAALQSLAPPEVRAAIESVDAKVEAKKLERRDCKRDIDRSPAVPLTPEPVVIDSAKVLSELEELEAFNATQDQADREKEQARKSVEATVLVVIDRQKRVEKLRAQLAEEEAGLAKANTDIEALRATAEGFPAGEPRKPTEKLRFRLAEAGATQEAHAHWEAAQRRLVVLAELSQEANRLDGEVKALEKERVRLAKELEQHLPIPGLAWTAKGVTMGGIAWESLSTAEGVVASVKIGMASNPLFHCIAIREGGLLDQVSFDALAAFVEEENAKATARGDEGWSIIMETARGAHEGPHQVILIEEGRTAAPAVPPEVQAHIDADRKPEADRVIDPWTEE
jgi:hypothetical protein